MAIRPGHLQAKLNTVRIVRSLLVAANRDRLIGRYSIYPYIHNIFQLKRQQKLVNLRASESYTQPCRRSSQIKEIWQDSGESLRWFKFLFVENIFAWLLSRLLLSFVKTSVPKSWPIFLDFLVILPLLEHFSSYNCCHWLLLSI